MCVITNDTLFSNSLRQTIPIWHLGVPATTTATVSFNLGAGTTTTASTGFTLGGATTSTGLTLGAGGLGGTSTGTGLTLGGGLGGGTTATTKSGFGLGGGLSLGGTTTSAAGTGLTLGGKKQTTSKVLLSVHTERKRKFSLMFEIFSLISFACSLNFSAFAWCEWAPNVEIFLGLIVNFSFKNRT